MRNVSRKFGLWDSSQVIITPLALGFTTSNKNYLWEDITEIKCYDTMMNGDEEEVQLNFEITFRDGDGFRLNFFWTGASICSKIQKGLATYLPGFDMEQAGKLAFEDSWKKRKYLFWLGIFCNYYWGKKPVVFSKYAPRDNASLD